MRAFQRILTQNPLPKTFKSFRPFCSGNGDNLGWDSGSNSWSTGLTKEHFDGEVVGRQIPHAPTSGGGFGSARWTDKETDILKQLQAENRKGKKAFLVGWDNRMKDINVLMKQNFFETRLNVSVHSKHNSHASLASPYDVYRSCLPQYNTMVPSFPRRFIATGATSVDMVSEDASLVTPRIKFKRLDKTAKHIMQILDKEAVGEVRAEREIPDIKPGYIVQLKVEVPENKRRVSTVKGIVIARRNAGLNTTFRLRRLVAGVGVENLFHLYSPNLKEIKVLDKKKVRRAKLYYLRDKMNALKKH